MVDIRIKDLPAGTPNQSKKLAMDLSSAESATIKDIVYAGRPAASQVQAETGTDPDAAMTPLTTKQAIQAQGASLFATSSEGDLAVTALQPGSTNPFFSGDVRSDSFTGEVLALKNSDEDNARYVWQIRPDDSLSLVQYDATTGDYIRDALNIGSSGALSILLETLTAGGRNVLLQSLDGVKPVRAGKYLCVGQEADFTGGQDKGALVIGDGFSSDGDTVSLTLDGMANWLAVRSDKPGNPQELIIYNGCLQGYANSVSGTNQLVRTTGIGFTAFAAGDAFYSHGKKFKIASITDDNNLTVTKFDGSPQTFTASINDLYTWCYTTGAGTCNISGNVVTRVSGAPLPTGFYRDMRLRINGTVRNIASFQGPSQLTLVDNLGTVSGASFDWRGDINDQMSSFRVQAIAGGNEENFNILVIAGSEFYGRHYSMISGVAGVGQTRSVGISAGYYGPYNPKYGVWVHREEGSHYGFTELGGGAGSGPFRVFMPQTQATGRPFVRIDPASTAGNPIGIQAWSDGASNTPLYLNPQGNSPVYLGSHYLNYLSVLPSNTSGQGPTMSPAGGDTNIDFNIAGKGTGGMNFGRNSPNHVRIDGALAGANPIISATGADTNIELTVQGKGAGYVKVGGGNLKLDNPTAADRMLRWTTNNLTRWIMGANGTAEGGSNGGSDFLIARYNDAGGLVGFPFGINRATGRPAFADLAASTSYANDAAAATGGVAVGQLYRNGSVVQIRVA